VAQLRGGQLAQQRPNLGGARVGVGLGEFRLGVEPEQPNPTPTTEDPVTCCRRRQRR
jgi:hypothetical protein